MGTHVRVLSNNSLLPFSALSTNTPYFTVTFFTLLGLLFAFGEFVWCIYYVLLCVHMFSAKGCGVPAL
jgi:hypothetical protein